MKEYIKAYLEKAGYAVNTVAADILWKADDWYRIRETDDHRRVTVSGERYSLARMGFAKRAAADDANLCEVVEINAGSNDEAVHEILAANPGKPLETIKVDTERDNFMTAEEAQAYGLVDKVIYKRQ